MSKTVNGGHAPLSFNSLNQSASSKEEAAKAAAARKNTPEYQALRRKAHEAAQKFEAVFLKEMLKVGMPKESEKLFGGGLAGDFFQDMQIDEQAQAMAKTGGFGLAEILEKEMMAIEDKKFKPEPKTDDKIEKKVNQLRARKSYS